MDEPQQTTHNHTQCQWWLTKPKSGCGGKEGAHSSINTNTTMSCVCEHHLVSLCSHKGDMVTTWQTHHMGGKGDCTQTRAHCVASNNGTHLTTITHKQMDCHNTWAPPTMPCSPNPVCPQPPHSPSLVCLLHCLVLLCHNTSKPFTGFLQIILG